MGVFNGQEETGTCVTSVCGLSECSHRPVTMKTEHCERLMTR